MNPEVVKLTERMLKKKLFVMLRRTVAPEKIPDKLIAHLQWMIEAERKGHLFASGPFVVAGQAPGAAGSLSILRADSMGEAEKVANEDPFVQAGIIAYEMKEWSVMEGGFSVRVNFSDQTYQFD
jgi:uncharacterized protein YciI